MRASSNCKTISVGVKHSLILLRGSISSSSSILCIILWERMSQLLLAHELVISNVRKWFHRIILIVNIYLMISISSIIITIIIFIEYCLLTVIHITSHLHFSILLLLVLATLWIYHILVRISRTELMLDIATDITAAMLMIQVKSSALFVNLCIIYIIIYSSARGSLPKLYTLLS